MLKKSWFFKTHEIARRGIPDIILSVRGRFVALELKVDSGLDELQIYTLKKIEESGGLQWVVTPINWKHILKIIKEIK